MRRLSLVVTIVAALALAGFAGRGFLDRSGYAVTPGASRDDAAAYTDGRPNLVAAMFYSAWCSSCAVLEPKLRRVVPEFEGRAVEFTKFDFSLGQPESLTGKARELGVERVYLINKGATGFMALIDRRNQSVIANVTMSQSENDIRRTLESAIEAASRSAP